MPLFAKKTESPEFYRFFKNVLGFTPRRVELYRTAFIHRSVSAESEGHRINNERLEYLGDAVLGAVVAEYLYKKYPLKGEGFLTEMRSKIVSRKSLGQLARKIGMQELIQHQRGGEGAFKSIGGDAFEALIGAIYIERGYRFTRKIIIDKMLRTYIDVDEVAQTDWNYKGKLIDWGQKNHQKVTFEIVRSTVRGRSGRKEYECCVSIAGKPQQSAVEYTVKAAEQLAAEKTYKAMEAAGKTKPAGETK
ncbi:MAG: ribonuclease III [Bacteroidales bacterium]|nr:ribonuclease III [Bacteroidales bacterium]